MVYIKKVEIFGFKSFGFKNTTVLFEPGLISISGPNGSGKSNILDAIIFAMGENKPKVMRVDKLRSLIHDTEGNRHGPKMARSSVHFDNSDRKIPINSDLVEITRELDENGENTYYLNKKKTNRSHILDLLDMANAGLGQLNAVQQGTVTRISEFTSEEKRKTIEDLIGLSYFDEKKAESLKQLEDADRRLEIALAKMGEIKKRIDELEEERNQKLRFDLVTRELNRYKAISAANQLKTVTAEKTSKESDLHSITSQITTLDNSRTVIRKETAELDAQKSKLMSSADIYNKAKSSLDSDLSRALEQYETLNSTISVSEKRLNQIKPKIPDIDDQITGLTSTKSKLDAEILEVKESLNKTTIYKDQIKESIHQIDSKRNAILAEQSRIASKKSELDKTIQSLTNTLNDTKLKLAKIQHGKSESDDKIHTNSEKLVELKASTAKLIQYQTRLETMLKNHNETISQLKSQIAKFHANKSKILYDCEDLELVLEKSSKVATQYDSKIKTVKGFMHEDYTVAKLKEDPQILGIHGLVYEIISWDKQYERCILAVGSDWIKSLVVDDFSTLLGIAQIAKDKKLSKLKIIPLGTIPKFDLTLPDEPGILGILSDFVKCDPQYSSLKTFLFGNVILTQDKESAFNLSQLGYRSVTLTGEYFEADGGTVVIDINSKISKLTKLISMSSDIDGLLRHIALIKRYVQKKKRAVKGIDESIQTYTQRLSLSEQSLTSANENYSSLNSKIKSAQIIRDKLTQRISDLQSNSRSIESQISTEESNINSLQQQITTAKSQYTSHGGPDHTAKQLSDVNQIKSDCEKLHTQVMEQYQSKSYNLTALEAQQNGIGTQLSNLIGERAALISEQQQLDIKIRDMQKSRASQNEILVNLRDKEQKLISNSGSSIDDIKEFDSQLTDLSSKERDLTKQINTYERQSDSLKRDLGDLVTKQSSLNQVLTSFGFEQSTETFDVEFIIDGLSSELSSLSALNAKAPQTYLEVSYGYRSMSDRKNSLEEERNRIVKFIEDIERDKRQTFLDAFDQVDKEIRLIFHDMTDGNAWLELQDEDDIFNSGISYMIQFPNKPKRESTSISGGEKTLAAVVFVLALQKLKPSPFYLFDEVDAHLDAPNAKRLAKILEERSLESQFLMVSLKDSVIQKAKLIYGVFPKNGVSNVVTYKDKLIPSVNTV